MKDILIAYLMFYMMAFGSLFANYHLCLWILKYAKFGGTL